MRIIVTFPSLRGILDEHGNPTQEDSVLREWLKAKLEEHSLSLPHTITQEAEVKEVSTN